MRIIGLNIISPVHVFLGCVTNDIIYKYIEDIQIFGMNMSFISSSEAKNAYFLSCEAMNEIYFSLLHEMK